MDIQKRVQTVTGCVPAAEFYGFTLMHEHLHIKCDFTPMFIPMETPKDVSFNMKHLHWISQHPYSYRDNLLVDESLKDIMLEEVRLFLQYGGQNIVDVTTEGLYANPLYLKALVEKLPSLNIVKGTGYYVDSSQKESTKSLSTEVMCNKMYEDITTGFPGTDVKAGIIGEVGCQWPLTDFEKRSLRAAAHTQTSTGCPITVHPGRDPHAPEEIVRILLEAGCDINKVVMGHLDRTIQDEATLVEFAKHGCYCEWDLFGIETSHYQHHADIDMPSDAERIKMIKCLLKDGYEDKIVLAHDIHTKHRLVSYGGHGFAHISNNVLPTMRKRGISEEQVNKMTKDNPATLLAFK